MTPITEADRPPAWEILERALTQRRTVQARYHGHQRLLCPHALGWKNGRAKALVYQVDGHTSSGPLPTDARQRWRSMFIDEIEGPTITDEEWQTAGNYWPVSNGIDAIVVGVE